MKKTIGLLIAFLLFSGKVYAFTDWAKASPASTDNAATLATSIDNNNTALDLLLQNMRRDCTISSSGSSSLTVNAGEIAIPNSDGSVVKYRANTTTLPVTSSNLDTGVMATTTQYYVYAVGDANASTFTVSISTSSSSPNGATNYRKIGFFYADGSGNWVSIGNVRGGDVAGMVVVKGTTDISTSSTSYADIADMTIYFVCTGRPVLLTYNAPSIQNTSEAGSYQFTVDGSSRGTTAIYTNSGTPSNHPLTFKNEITGLSVGLHTFKVQWAATSGRSLYQDGSTVGQRLFIAEEK